MTVEGLLVSELPPLHERVLADDEVLEGEVLTRTKIIGGRRSVIRYCTLGACLTDSTDEYPDPEKPRVERCLITSETDVAKLWDMAAQYDDVGHLAAP